MVLLDFATIKEYYDEKIWTKEMVWNAVGKGKIKPEEYKLITGDDYVA